MEVVSQTQGWIGVEGWCQGRSELHGCDSGLLSRPGISGPIWPHPASPDPCPNPTSYPAPATWSCMSSHCCWSAPNGPWVQPNATWPHPHGRSDVRPPLANPILGPPLAPRPLQALGLLGSYGPALPCSLCHSLSLYPPAVHHSVPTLAKMLV